MAKTIIFLIKNRKNVNAIIGELNEKNYIYSNNSTYFFCWDNLFKRRCKRWRIPNKSIQYNK